MSKIKAVLSYNGANIDIQCFDYETLEELCKKFSVKSKVDMNNISLLYSGHVLNDWSLTIAQVANNQDKERKIISVIVIDSQDEPEQKSILVKSNLPICPICLGNSKLEMEDNFTFKLTGCKNNHEIIGLRINDFEKTQNIDLAKIKCSKCDNNIANTYGKQMFICNICQVRLCPLCRQSHDKTHKLVEYNSKNYYCELDSEPYTAYCVNCQKNICTMCEKDHNGPNHQKKYYGTMLPDKAELLNKLKDYKSNIDLFNRDISQVISKLNFVREKVNTVYKIENEIVNKYEDNYRNYEIFASLYNIKNDKCLNKIKEINQKEEIKDKIDEIVKIYNNLNYANDITIVYNNNGEGKIQLFDESFVNKYKDKCKIKYEYLDYDLTSEFDTRNITQNKIEIKLTKVNEITNINKMFYNCEQLESLSNTSNWDTSKITNMSYAFDGCSSLKSLPDIDKWKTDNVENMQNLFNECKSLASLPDISRWNTSKVTNMSNLFNECSDLACVPDISKWNLTNVTNLKSMFCGCSKITSLPDISKWDTKNVTTIANIFKDCSSLASLPDISKWNTSNLQSINHIFKDCCNITTLPDISKWNTQNMTDMSYAFSGCEKLTSLPDISKWDTRNVTLFNRIFEECKQIDTLPDISQWNTDKVTNMSYIFSECHSLKVLPDLSKWDMSNVTDFCSMFCNCKNLACLPNISNWNTSNVTDISSMFSGCKILRSLPDISRWDTSKVEDMGCLFNECSSLISLPDINRWNIDKVQDMGGMFNLCDNLSNIPDKFK